VSESKNFWLGVWLGRHIC